MGNILIIDDESTIRLFIRKALEADGHVITEASDGSEGIYKYHENPVDVIITDLIMPNKEGLETIHELKKEYPAIKIVAMSGSDRIHLNTAKLLGAETVLKKPFNKEVLLTAVRSLLPVNKELRC